MDDKFITIYYGKKMLYFYQKRGRPKIIAMMDIISNAAILLISSMVCNGNDV